jgi:hypothetical protein
MSSTLRTTCLDALNNVTTAIDVATSARSIWHDRARHERLAASFEDILVELYRYAAAIDTLLHRVEPELEAAVAAAP